MMRKLSKKDMEELREFLDRGCDYAGTQEVVNDLVSETLKEIGTEYPYGNEISLFDGDDQFSTVDEFANIFWDKAIEKILNVVETQGKQKRMREILFKAKRKDNSEWVEGYYRSIPCMGMLEHYIMPRNPKNRMEQYAIAPDTLCQYTGLTDKNGKKIWENDIISIHSYSYYEPEDDYFGVVKYCEKDACWVLKNNERFNEIICECFGSYTTQMINHGNIFDNADLMEVE